jgi:hypothetical protein
LYAIYLIIRSYGEPKQNPVDGKWSVGLHGNMIGNIYTNTEQARSIRRLIIARLRHSDRELEKFPLDYWIKAFDYGVYGLTEGENAKNPDKREGEPSSSSILTKQVV